MGDGQRILIFEQVCDKIGEGGTRQGGGRGAKDRLQIPEEHPGGYFKEAQLTELGDA